LKFFGLALPTKARESALSGLPRTEAGIYPADPETIQKDQVEKPGLLVAMSIKQQVMYDFTES